MSPRGKRPDPFQKNFRKSVLKNGLTVLTERTPGMKSASIGVWVRAGTRHEAPKEAGISHFLEHMLFKGTKLRSATEITRAIERVGGEFNAYTTREHTCFYVTLLERDLELGMQILSDIVMSSTFDSVEIERERKVILQELSMVDESPEEISQDVFFELAYGNHGLGRPILGSINSVRKMKRADLLRYFKKHYRPENLIISVAADVPHARVLKAVRDLSRKSWPGRPARRPRMKAAGFQVAPRLREGLFWVKRPTEQAHIVWGVETPKYTAKEQPAVLLIASYLGGGMSSSLFRTIREEHGLAYSVYASLSLFFDSGVLSVYVGSTVKQVPLCLKLIEEGVTRLCTQPLSDRDLQEEKDSMKGTLLVSSDSVDAAMNSIAIDEIYFGRSFSVQQACEELDAVTATDIQQVAKKIFGDGRRSIVVYGPRPSVEMRKKLKPEFPKRYRLKT